MLRFPAGLVIAGLIAGGASAGELHLELIASGAPLDEAVTAQLIFTPTDDRQVPLELQGELPGRVTLDLPTGQWQLTAKAEGRWAPPRLVEGAATVKLQFFPTTLAEGRFRVPRGEAPPEGVQARLSVAHDPPDRPNELSDSAECALEKDAFRCLVPAIPLDLEIWPLGFIPIYRWAVEPGTESVFDLGRLELSKGASITGWVATEDGSDLPRARVDLSPAGFRGPGSPGELLHRTAEVEENGFFQLRDIPQGEFAVSARADGYAPAVVNVSVLEEIESRLRHPLVLGRPVELTVIVDPPTDPEGDAWRLNVGRLDPYRNGLVAENELLLDLSGVWEQLLSPGTYLLSLKRQNGDTLSSREIMVGEEPMPILLEPGIVKVEGEVMLGRDPLPATTIWFGGRFGGDKVETVSDENGRYEVILPRSGKWRIEIEADDPRVSRAFPALEIPEPRYGLAELDIELPNTLVRGRVVLEDGTPVDRAIVTAASRDENGSVRVQQIIEEEGEFEFHGLPEGPVSLGAKAPEGESEWLEIELMEDRETTEQRLVLLEKIRVSGRLVAGGQPLVGGLVTIHPVADPNTPSPWISSGRDGGFLAALPRKTRDVNITFGAPGFGLKVVRRSISDGRLADLELTRSGGRLLVEMPENAYDPGKGWWPMLFQNGLQINRPWISKWASLHPSAVGGPNPGWIELQEMAPGRYMLCRIPSNEIAAWMLGSIDPARCEHGDLAARGELALSFPEGD